MRKPTERAREPAHLVVHIAAYNEESTIEQFLKAMKGNFIGENGKPKAGIRLRQIIVVDDGSKDKTMQTLERLKATPEFENLLTVVGLGTNQGVFQAKTTGMQTAVDYCLDNLTEKERQNAVILRTDPDFEADPQRSVDAVQAIRNGKGDVAIAASSMEKARPVDRTFHAIAGKYGGIRFAGKPLAMFEPATHAYTFKIARTILPEIWAWKDVLHQEVIVPAQKGLKNVIVRSFANKLKLREPRVMWLGDYVAWIEARREGGKIHVLKAQPMAEQGASTTGNRRTLNRILDQAISAIRLHQVFRRMGGIKGSRPTEYLAKTSSAKSR